jgi:hypothetical protein
MSTRAARRLLPLLLPLAAACSDESGLKVYNTAPTVSIVSPSSGSVFEEGDLVEFRGVARDNEEPNESLQVLWVSNKDGDLGVSPPDAEGQLYLAVSALSVNVHVVTLSAVDASGEQATTAVSIQVTEAWVDPNAGKPTVVLTGPPEDSSFVVGETIRFVGTATDAEQTWDTLQASLSSDRDGTLWTGNPGSNGVVSVDVDDLSAGWHVVILSVVDDDGHAASDDVSLTVIGDHAPSAEILLPEDRVEFLISDTVVFEGQVEDDLTPFGDLEVLWESSLLGELHAGWADGVGSTRLARALPEGVHIVTLTTWDAGGQTDSDSVTITVRDPLNVDNDMDGYTEAGGDCDDDDVRVHPGASEICNDRDDDCDGLVNEDWLDAFEPNDSVGTGYDLGMVDVGWLWDGSSVTIAGLSLHTSGDQDWFLWDAKDEWYDDANISVRVSGLVSGGAYAVELYLQVGTSWTLKNSASGSGTLTVAWPGTGIDMFDVNEDLWAVVVRSTTWPSTACSSSYTLTIST